MKKFDYILTSSEKVNNNPRASKINLASKAMTQIVQDKDNRLCTELQRYEDSTWWSSEEELIKQHGPLLFFKENEKVIYIY